MGAGRRANARACARRWDRTLVPTAENSGRITRRHLLAAGGTAGAAAFVALNPQLAAAATAVVGDPAHLRRATYLQLIGQEFSLGWWGSSTSLQLAAISDLEDLKSRDDAFSLTFLGNAATPDMGASVALSHPKLGRFELFLVPIDRASDPQHYEAIINRSRGVERKKAPKPGDPPKHHAKKPRKKRRRKNAVADTHHRRRKHLSRRARKRAAKPRG